MSIVLLYQDQYPWDVRVEKMVEGLAAHNYDVHIVSRNRTGLARCEDIGPRLTVHRLPPGFGPVTRELINVPAFFSPFWIRELSRTVTENGAQLIIVRDLPLAPAAILVGKKLGIPVLMDMAENYPAMLSDTWSLRTPGMIDRLIRNPTLLRIMERWVARHVDGILVVSRASAERVRSLASDQQLWIVGNTPRLEESTHDIASPSPVADVIKNYPGLTLLYTGGMEESRGLQTVVRAMAIVKNRGQANVQFVIVGRGEAESALKELASDLGVGEQVVFAGWVDHASLPTLIRASDFCVIPHYRSEHIDTTLPNKLYDYMAEARAVISTDAPSLLEIVEGYGCGMAFRDRDADDCARCITTLLDDTLRNNLGQAGQRAVLDLLNWGRDEEVLVSAVADITTGRQLVKQG